MRFATKRISAAPDVVAPDGSAVRILLATARGSMAHFELAPGRVSRAIAHRTVEETWYVLTGRGQMWRADDIGEQMVDLEPGLCLTIPAGTRFQFRADDAGPLAAVAVTMPPWPGDDEAVAADGPWPPSL